MKNSPTVLVFFTLFSTCSALLASGCSPPQQTVTDPGQADAPPTVGDAPGGGEGPTLKKGSGEAEDITQWKDVSDKKARPIAKVLEEMPAFPDTLLGKKRRQQWLDDNLVGKVIQYDTTLAKRDGRKRVYASEYTHNGKTYYRATISFDAYVNIMEVKRRQIPFRGYNIPKFESFGLVANGLTLEEVDRLEQLNGKKVTFRTVVAVIDQHTFYMLLKNTTVNGIPLRIVHPAQAKKW